ncbi:MAG: tRNA (adenosine(37)-N6)-threonylcarbamoyltransferase complex ATPase subunit type 1 TsaE [Patescibacteria group bacterium]
MVTQTKTADQTVDAGRALAKKMSGGELLLLTGELGSGKTTFVKGLAQGLGVKEDVRSATFLLMTPYSAHKQLTFVHVDGYRLTKPDEVRSIGLQDYLGRPDVVVAIEWPQRLKPMIEKLKMKSEKLYEVTFETINEEARRISY